MEENRAKNLAALTVPLPEDIEKLKFTRALKIIENRLGKDIPGIMKERLVLERDIIRRLPLQYPFSHQAALAFATERIEGFSEEELENLIDENAIDWLYIEGERRIKDDFVDNLVKTRLDIRARIFDEIGSGGGRAGRPSA